MKIMKDFRNNLLKRREVSFVLEADSNLGFANAKKAVVDELKVSEENVVIKFIKNNFGSREFVIEAFVYDSKTQKELIEPRKKEKMQKETKKEEKK